MNLINELHERRYTIEGLSDKYYEEIMNSVKNFKSKGIELSESSYNEFAERDSRLDHVPYREFKKLMELDESYKKLLEVLPVGRFSRSPGGIKGDELRREIRAITNKALIRRLSQDMCEDAKTILDSDYMHLCKLGYLGEMDEAIPEVVRGNFLMYAKREILKKEVIGCNEAIDRMQYVLKRTSGERHIVLDENAVERYFVKEPIDSIRRELGRMKCPPIEDYREKYLSDFYEEKFQRFKNSDMDVENRKGKKIKKIMAGTEFVTEKDYREISDLGYDGKTEHPIIQSGYKLYTEIYAFNKTKENQLNLAKIFYSDVCKIPGVKENLESPEIPDEWNCMTDLRDYFTYKITSSRYNKGKATKAEYERAKKVKEQNDRYSAPIRLAKMIGGLENVSFDNRKDIDER